MNELFPIFLKLRNRRVLVVGGGRVAASRVRQLLGCGARITVVAPEACGELQRLAAVGSIQWWKRPFMRSDVSTNFLIVVGTTDDPVCQQTVADEAERKGLLYNVVDAAEKSNFYTPAVVARGDLKIAISTSGKSPVLARYLRQELESALPAYMEEVVEELGALRDRLKTKVAADPDTRKMVIEQVIGNLVEK